MLAFSLQFPPALEPGFQPAALWHRTYEALVARDPGARPLSLSLGRPDGTVLRHDTRVLGANDPNCCARPVAARRRAVVEIPALAKGRQPGARRWRRRDRGALSPGALCAGHGGARSFDYSFMRRNGLRAGVVLQALDVWSPSTSFAPRTVRPPAARPAPAAVAASASTSAAADRKVAALIDGKVVFSEEVAWDPYFQKDPAYHIEGVHASLLRAAAHLPRVDAIGGSAAGVYVNNEVRVASLFRGVPADQFARHIRGMFRTLRARWGDVPFEVANDGEVTALAGSMALQDNAVLGVSMGTSMAGGYVRASGDITTWLNELAFAPVDYNPGAAGDEWSGDSGCGVQYFSQQVAWRGAGAARAI